MKNKQEEEYEFSVCSEDAIRQFWSKDLEINSVFFEGYMVELQIALIECHMKVMFPSDKRRALKTIQFLKNVQRGKEKYGK